MNIIGQLLLWCGFLSGALATVIKLEIKPVLDASGLPIDPWEKWGTIMWPWYIISVIVCASGIVVMRIGKASETESSEMSAAGLNEIKLCLDNLIQNVGELKNRLDSMAPSQIVAYIDDELSEDFRGFADGRESITVELGLQKFADVMSQFSAGERALNRAWSASADGYIDEAATCVQRGEIMLVNARNELNNSLTP